jgi:anti-sigma factor RsiW
MSVHAGAGVRTAGVPAAAMNQRHRGTDRDPHPARQSTLLLVTRELVFPSVLSVLIAGLLAVTAVTGLVWGQQGLYRADPARCQRFWARMPSRCLRGSHC